jgi:hypothetical protein
MQRCITLKGEALHNSGQELHYSHIIGAKILSHLMKSDSFDILIPESGMKEKAGY